jgi:hypothetical protein
MRNVLAMGLLLVALGTVGAAKGQEEPKPSPIPEKLQGEAKKAFAKKAAYFIWIEEKMVTSKDLKLRYATHPDQKEEPASTVIRLIRPVRGMNVPWAGYSQGIVTFTSGPSDLKGAVEATIYLIKEEDQIKEEKAPAISNTLKVKVKFE